MSKTLFTAALAFVLSIGGMVLSAADSSKLISVYAKMDVNLRDNLAASANESHKSFGYKKQGEDGFHPLSEAMNAEAEDGKVTFLLGQFSHQEAFQLGFADDDGENYTAASAKVASDPGYYGEYNADSFYQLDFSKDPFDGMIDILVMGEPLPPSTVTLLVALALATAFLLYKNNRERMRCPEQA